jgi:tetratricopeptide (TPR) repeat protein
MRSLLPRVLLALMLFVLVAQPAGDPLCAQEPRLGTVSFPNSGAREAQEAFLHGLAALHSFEYLAARRAFREAQKADPDFAMAYWGEAMTFNHPLWYRQFRDDALQTLARYAPTSEERLTKAPTDRERQWLAALEILYGAGDKQDRDDRYERAMAELHRAYPDDPEAIAFHVLSILGTAHEGRDHRTYMRAGAIAMDLLNENPQHPGAAHYTIHSFDDPVHAPLGLAAARAYSEIAPDAAHAQHMTSHIFMALGLWDDVVRANERSDAVSDKDAVASGRDPRSCGHYNEWLEYGYLMQGRQDDALDLLMDCATQQTAVSDGRYLESFANMRSRYVLDAEEWAGDALAIEVDLSGSPGASLTDAFIRGFAAARLGDVQNTRRALERIRAIRPDVEADMAELGRTEEAYVRRPSILELQIEGLLDWALGNYLDAIAHFGEAARMEEVLPYAFGPPVIEKPSHELLGEALLEHNSDTTASEVFSEAVARTPGRIPALRGLLAAAEAADDPELARWAEAELEARNNADRSLGASRL